MTTISRLKSFAAFVGALVLAGVVLFFRGKAAARRELELERAKASANALEERAKTNAEVASDTDLLDRARRSGVVRKAD
ncbi:hypothetical protein RCSPARTAN_4 [Rhodobacter phage RcSpartan]|uniref:Uncharacterized protein n=1 Tax=Rhodobacter phage RcSpartan TaxID=1662331 RepID=A0A0K1LL14_9CAUD|nr:hypothetical protein FDH88_gp04 [Rhodobacter phage RcSpartan]AKU43187.1 hypothetical protein RCSPARTAN_4 [Rhodobacter phage RcSpartan]QXN71373.1 hypothetical protein RCHARTNEY_4 [Rhodobacter phage RcHartney]